MSDLDEQLTEGERVLISGLLRFSKETEVQELADYLDWMPTRVVSILQSLKERGFVRLRDYDHVTYLLTNEGEEYLENGLPEDRLFNAIQEKGGNAVLDDAILHAKLDKRTAGIAISRSKKNGWIRTQKEQQKTTISLVVELNPSNAHLYLKTINEQDYSPSENWKDAFKELIERGLAKVKESRKSIFVELENSKLEQIDKILSSESGEIGNLTRNIIAHASWKEKSFRSYNVESIPPITNRGKKHPYAEFNDWLKEILIGMGFTEWFGPYVETEFWNNDTLFVPQDHVAREVQDQFRVGEPYSHGTIFDKKYYKAVKGVHEDGGDTGSIGWQAPFSKEIAERLCLRAHTTPVSMRYLSEHRESPQKMFIVDRNFRSESLSARHAQEFNQCEGIIMDKGLNLRDLMGYLTTICHSVGIKKIKFKPGQFPFTEPSVECFAKHETLGWIEVAPGGIFRPEVTRPLGIKDSVLAWGIGSGRLYMAAMGIGDIRDLYSRDLKWLREKYFVR